MSEIHILLVDDEPDILKWIKKDLESQAYIVYTAESGPKALDCIRNTTIDILITDIKMPGMDGVDLIKSARKHNPELHCIVFTGRGELHTARETIKLSVIDYLLKPVDKQELFDAVRKALEEKEKHRLAYLAREELANCTIPIPHLEKVQEICSQSMIGQSEAMKKIFELIAQTSSSDSNILIAGESGTGKELVAKAVHENSRRSQGPFIVVNCAALPDELIESELFGYSRGAFTGAISNQKGKFEEADTGAIFLDEIGDMRPWAQAKILRVLQDKKITRLGSNKPIAVDVRIIAATNKDLWQAVRKGDFREDLFHRLNVFPIQLPPLRERKEDIEPLVTYFIDAFNQSTGKKVNALSPKALEKLIQYDWPGNVRELENAIERALVRVTGTLLTEKHFDLSGSLGIEKSSRQRTIKKEPPDKITGRAHENNAHPSSPSSLRSEKPDKELVQFIKRVIIGQVSWNDREGYLFGEKEKLKTLAEELHGDGSKMAKVLEINKNNLNQILRRYGLRLREIKARSKS